MEEFCQEQPARAQVSIEGRTVHLRAWRYTVRGFANHEVPVFLLDADLPENSEFDRTLTNHLYGGGAHYRFCEEAFLGTAWPRPARLVASQSAR